MIQSLHITMSEADLLLSQLDRIKSRLLTIKNESIKTKVNIKTSHAFSIIPVTSQSILNIYSAYSKIKIYLWWMATYKAI